MQNEILSKTKIEINQKQKEFCERNLELSELGQGMDHLLLREITWFRWSTS